MPESHGGPQKFIPESHGGLSTPTSPQNFIPESHGGLGGITTSSNLGSEHFANDFYYVEIARVLRVALHILPAAKRDQSDVLVDSRHGSVHAGGGEPLHVKLAVERVFAIGHSDLEVVPISRPHSIQRVRAEA